MSLPIETVRHFLFKAQEDICQAFFELDKKNPFQSHRWDYSHGGGGLSRVLCDGVVLEKAGVNVSSIAGPALPKAASELRQALTGCPFKVMGLSLVIHPQNPYVPTVHVNVRFFVVEKKNKIAHWWFGGGMDLTPYYAFIEDCVAWHRGLQKICEAFQPGSYVRFKAQCDDYFYLAHRKEHRGIGGIFFDDLTDGGFEKCFCFIKANVAQFLEGYFTLLHKRFKTPYGERERFFQRVRRGRYVEFNLMYDRGTRFGLQSGGRVESILMSLPLNASWPYDYKPVSGSIEDKLTRFFLQPRDWVNYEGF